jgi:hypothetical protein
MGVFDGHAKLGELVSEYTVSTLPKVLSAKLEIILAEAGIYFTDGCSKGIETQSVRSNFPSKKRESNNYIY